MGKKWESQKIWLNGKKRAKDDFFAIFDVEMKQINSNKTVAFLCVHFDESILSAIACIVIGRQLISICLLCDVDEREMPIFIASQSARGMKSPARENDWFDGVCRYSFSLSPLKMQNCAVSRVVCTNFYKLCVYILWLEKMHRTETINWIEERRFFSFSPSAHHINRMENDFDGCRERADSARSILNK